MPSFSKDPTCFERLLPSPAFLSHFCPPIPAHLGWPSGPFLCPPLKQCPESAVSPQSPPSSVSDSTAALRTRQPSLLLARLLPTCSSSHSGSILQSSFPPHSLPGHFPGVLSMATSLPCPVQCSFLSREIPNSQRAGMCLLAPSTDNACIDTQCVHSD